MPCSSDTVRSLEVEDVVGECEKRLAKHNALDLCVSIEPRRHEDQHADMRLLFADRKWLQSHAGKELIADLREHVALTDVQRHRSAILLRFDDAILARLEHRLARGELADMSTLDILDHQRLTVGFVGPNTNKALHVGHLRNVLLGQALASMASAAGATVQRHNLVGDIGRRVCEAIGGYITHHDGEDPQTAGLSGDRFVELCSRAYPRESSQPGVSERESDPNAEESETHGDLADMIMNAWLAGAAPERTLWRRMRHWALTGHRHTLGRLGVQMDRNDFESDGVERAFEVIASGLERGFFTREPNGTVIYPTGRSEYTTMVLVRKDGAPTEHARLLGVYHRMHEQLAAGALYVEVVGIEWEPPMAVLGELLTKLLEIPSEERYVWTFHGWVTVNGQKMGSSAGEVIWIEDLLDRVAAGPGVAALHELANGAISHEELADVVIRGTFLCSPTLQPLAFSLNRLLDAGAGSGWTIARAWCLAQHQSPPEQSSKAPVARTAIVQSQLYRRALSRAAKKRDVAILASYLLGLS